MSYHWVSASNGETPHHAIHGGQEPDGKPLYIARIFHDGGWQIGKAAPHLGGAHIPYGGKIIKEKNYEILVGESPVWEASDGGRVPATAFPAGNEKDMRVLYVARVHHSDGVHPGKVAPHLRAANFAFKEKEVASQNYEVLVVAYRWVESRGGEVPADAVQGGHEADGKPLYLARIAHEGGYHPGKVGRHLGGAYSSYAGKAIFAVEYEVLVGGGEHGGLWSRAEGGMIPENALEAGRERDGTILYISRAIHESGVHPGKVAPHLKSARFAYGEVELSSLGYEVLLNR